MLSKIKSWFSKGEEDMATYLPSDENATFVLKISDIDVGILHCENGVWEFSYTDEFKNLHNKEYKNIAAFPQLEKTYKKETLWPFFRIRIPGLKQPSIKKIIEEENIDTSSEVALLKRFGQHTISNPYELLPT